MKKNRELKVYESNGTYGSVTPLIRLQGKWVKDAGFEIGDGIKVEVENDKIIIKKKNIINRDMNTVI